MNNYTSFIGMEVHVELNADKKMFCGCNASHFQVEPNTHVCPVCLGLPGAMPVPNENAIWDVIKIGKALNCKINLKAKFDRKHYFYPDLPKGYQISQYDLPFCFDGSVTLSDGKVVRIRRVHLEEDTGKLKHANVDGRDVSMIDFNRSGVPLVEIVTEPDMETADEVKEYLKIIHSLVRYLGVSDADMEKGSMRLEANISVSKDKNLPPYKVEVKNVNSFRYIATSVDFEIERHKKIIEEGKWPAQETRGWDINTKGTVAQRSKEEAKDYRYFPEPDIPRIVLDENKVMEIEKNLPLLPQVARDQLISLGVRREWAVFLMEDKAMAEYSINLAKEAKIVNFEVDKVVGMLTNNKIDWKNKTVSEVLSELKSKSEEVKMDEAECLDLVNGVINDNPKVVADFKSGKENAIQFLMGQVMARSRGKADAATVMNLLKQRLISK